MQGKVQVASSMVSSPLLSRGRARQRARGCRHCHAGAGAGAGGVIDGVVAVVMQGKVQVVSSMVSLPLSCRGRAR